MEYLACSKCGRPVEDEPYCGDCVSDYCSRISALESESAQYREAAEKEVSALRFDLNELPCPDCKNKDQKLAAALERLDGSQSSLHKKLAFQDRLIKSMEEHGSAQASSIAAARDRAQMARDCLADSERWKTEQAENQCMRHLSSLLNDELGVPSARPDDGRVERVARVLFDTDYENRHNEPFPHDTRDWHHMSGTERFFGNARSVLEAADAK